MSVRAELLTLLADKEVLKLVKQDLTQREIADLILMEIKPGWHPPAERKAQAVAGVTASAIRQRKRRQKIGQ